ncbi:MAG: molybdopterin cofactor-binding domain-containing protein [Planctomycetota bacterium]
MKNTVTFYLNGKHVEVKCPSPHLLLIDYLRSPEIGLTGAKKSCGEGGCGACTVILSRWKGHDVEHLAINSCLRPICSLGGLSVTTIEGTGTARPTTPAFLHHSNTYSQTASPISQPTLPNVFKARNIADQMRTKSNLDHSPPLTTHSHNGVNPVAFRLAMNNGTQCGYCTVGFVMNMTEFLKNTPIATKAQIESIFDGNICRCTGYRPILTGMKTFAVDWSAEDEQQRMNCLPDDDCTLQEICKQVQIPFPDDAKTGPIPVEVSNGQKTWFTPTTLEELYSLLRKTHSKPLTLVSGHTSFGIYPREFLDTNTLIDVRLIAELQQELVEQDKILIGAAVTYSRLIELLSEVLRGSPDNDFSAFVAIKTMCDRTAGRIVRNAATVAGNLILVLKHIHHGPPFASDLATALVAVNAKVFYYRVSITSHVECTVEQLVDECIADESFASDIVLISFSFVRSQRNEVVLSQKVALREVNAHSILNATSRLVFDDSSRISEIALVYGGLAPHPWRPFQTESLIRSQGISLDNFKHLADTLIQEIETLIVRCRPRLQEVSSDGFSDEYRTQLAVSFLYKTLVNALHSTAPQHVNADLRSVAHSSWGRWPVSTGRQSYTVPGFRAPLSQPHVSVMALSQALGKMRYTQELPILPRTLHAAFVLSRRGLSEFYFVNPDTQERVTTDGLSMLLEQQCDGFVNLVTHEDVPAHGINLQGMGADQPLFAVERVHYVGQAICLVVARCERDANAIAEYVARLCIGYTHVPWPSPWNRPVASLDDAIRMGSIFPDNPKAMPFISHIWRVTRPGSEFEWTTQSRAPLDKEIYARSSELDGVPCQIVESTQTTGAQLHFYMETQGCIVQPVGRDNYRVYSSTQSPMEVHQTIAMALGIHYNKIDLETQQLGGGFGGKSEQSRFVAGPVAVAAYKCKETVRLVMPRNEDSSMIGKRHAYYGQYQIAVDNKGIIRGFQSRMWGDGGAFYDCSFIVSNCMQLRVDNAYRIRHFRNDIDVCRTNKAPSTAMRGFGDIQCMLIVENAIDDAAFAIGRTAEEIREANLYERGDVTPFGQALSDCYLRNVWDYLKQECHFEKKRQDVAEFNRTNRWRKRGIAMIPIKYGSGYNLLQLEQAAAIVVVYSGDGSVVVHQGGVEMGQGITTLVSQIASYILNIPIDLIRVEGPRTSVTPNPTSTGGSTGTAYNGQAVKETCEALRDRLIQFGYSKLTEKGEEWCVKNGIDFWNHGRKGWAAETRNEHGQAKLMWQNLVQLAYTERVSLISSFTAKIRGGESPVPAITFKPASQQAEIPGIEIASSPVPRGAVDSFVGFTYSAAASVVEIDVLTGETKVLSVDICYDIGSSLNPALDVGQVEGAFVQGLGYVLSENLVFQHTGDECGRLNTVNTWNYKPPAHATIPLEFNVRLFPRELVANIPEANTSLFSSKEVGEPPLILAVSVFFAIKSAIRVTRQERGLSGLFRFDAPATVQEVRRACEVLVDHLQQPQPAP